MKKNYSITTYFILVPLFLLTACVTRYHNIDELREYGYDIYVHPHMLRGLTMVKYHSGNTTNNEEIIEKSISYWSDSTAESLSYSFRSLDETKSLYLDFNQEIFANYTNQNQDIKFDTLLEFEFQQYLYDSIANLHTYLDSENEGGILELSTETDTFYSHRELEISEEVKNHYWMLKQQLVDSITYMPWSKLPDISSCDELIFSEYIYTTCLSQEDGYYREIDVDSLRNSEGWAVNRDTNFYYLIETRNEDGSNSFYHKTKYLQNETVEITSQGYPISLKNLTFNPTTGDTLTSLEMTSKKIKKDRWYEYKYTIHNPKITEKSTEQIIEKHVSVRRNEKGEIIYYRAIGYTQNGYKLELERALIKGIWATLKNENAIPEIDPAYVYRLDMNSFADFVPLVIYMAPKNRKSINDSYLVNYHVYRKYFRQSDFSAEKDKKNKTEIWTNSDSSNVYEIKYGLK